MSDQFSQDELDQLFQSAIEPMEVEPSAQFWETAEKNIALRNAEANKKKAGMWKRLSLLLLLLLGTSAGYITYLHLSDRGQYADQTNGGFSETETSLPVGNNGEGVQRENENQDSSIPAVSSTDLEIKNQSALVTPGENSQVRIDVQAVNAEQLTKSNVANPENGKAVNNFQSHDQSPLVNTNGVVTPEEINNGQIIPPVVVKNEEPQVIPGEQPTNDNTPPVVVIADTTRNGEPLAIADETNHDTTLAHDTDAVRNIFVGGFFAPGFTAQHVSNSEPDDNQNQNQEDGNNVSEDQDAGHYSWSAGIKMGYDLTKHWTLRGGVAYTAYRFPIASKTIYTNPATAPGSYRIVTSAGVAEFDDENNNDSLQIEENSYQSLSYWSVPLQGYYRFGSGNVSFFAGAGLSPHFLGSANAHLQLTDENDEETFVDQDIQEIRRFGMGYNVGFGMNYRMRNRFMLTTEPYLNGNFHSISNNTSIGNYPLTWGISFGLSWYL